MINYTCSLNLNKIGNKILNLKIIISFIKTKYTVLDKFESSINIKGVQAEKTY